ncbi:Induced myeloid leukemia cell differentiation protein Mcl-1-like protein [Heterocephalus glaber]|uniref:Induced myeloid leukemia cell differentiation protein Mcl-1-like protein n=1 Tax=Heterocephalus glaber TaxID=10181 RepID=G5BRJ4_HETGA|nr:Induced myeloid leukemia cell differentiation protein Mcl-1-like protein [Heterocephalus glaber]
MATTLDSNPGRRGGGEAVSAVAEDHLVLPAGAGHLSQGLHAFGQAPGRGGEQGLAAEAEVGQGRHAAQPLGGLPRNASKTGHQKRLRCQILVMSDGPCFSDGITDWGRIVTLISFGAFVAKHLKSINQESCIEPLADSITEVLIQTKRDWLIKQRGWDGFVEFFHIEDLEGCIRNGLLAFAGVAGVGAGLAYLIK